MKDHKQQESFLKAYDELADQLFRHCYFRISNYEAALDMVQDGFSKTWQHLAQGNEVRNFKPFLYQVMNHLIIDYYRKSKSSSLDSLIDEGFDPKDASVDIEKDAEFSLVVRSLSSLSKEDKEVVVLRHIDGLSIGEISKFLGESENVVSVRLHRAIKKLKKILSHEKH